MHKSRIHVPKIAQWHEFIADSEREIRRAEARIVRLKGGIELAKERQAKGDPFPDRSYNFKTRDVSEGGGRTRGQSHQ